MKCSFRGFTWMVDPRMYAPGDAALDVVSSILTGKNSRLYTRLVYEMIAQDVTAVQQGEALGGSFLIVATAKPGHTIADPEGHRRGLDKPAATLPNRVSCSVLNQIEASFYRGMERVGGFGGKADQLNAYYFAGGGPDFYAEDLARYMSLSPTDIQAAVRRWLPPDRRVELIVEPATAK